MNKVLIVGRMVSGFTEKNTFEKWAYNTVAVMRTYKNKNGEYDSDFIPITLVNDKTIKFASRYVEKGDIVEVIGSFRSKKIKDNRTTYDVVVDDIKLFKKHNSNQVEEDNEEEEQEENENLTIDDLLGDRPTLDDINRAGKKVQELDDSDLGLPF